MVLKPIGDRGGMTVVEVTIALTIVATVLTGGYSLYGTIQSVGARVDESLTEVRGASNRRSALESWLRYPVVRTAAGFYGFDQTWQREDDDRLQLWVRSPMPGARGLWRLELLIDHDDVMPEAGLVAIISSPVDERVLRVEVVPEAGSFDLAFLGADGSWLSSWASESVAPRAARIELGPRPGAELPPLLRKRWLVVVGDNR